MARRKIATIVDVTPGTELTGASNLFGPAGAGVDIPEGNLIRIAIISRLANKLTHTEKFGVGNLGHLNDAADLVATSDNLFESTFAAGGKFQAQLSITSIVDKFIVEIYLDY